MNGGCIPTRLPGYFLNGNRHAGGGWLPPKKLQFPSEYVAFLAECPAGIRFFFAGERPTETENIAFLTLAPEEFSRFNGMHDDLLKRFPEVRKWWEKYAARIVTNPKVGRPRKDERAREAQRLREQGLSYAEAALKLGATKENLPQIKESIRKLVKSRQTKAPGKNSR